MQTENNSVGAPGHQARYALSQEEFPLRLSQDPINGLRCQAIDGGPVDRVLRLEDLEFPAAVPGDNNSPSTLEPSCLLLDKELFLRFPYHPLPKAAGNFESLCGGSHGTSRNPTLPNEAADEGPLGDQIGKRGSSDGVRGHHVSRRLLFPADRN